MGNPRFAKYPDRRANWGALIDELLSQDLRVAGDVVDVLLGVDRGYLASQLFEALDDAHGGVTVATVVGRGKPGRPTSDDGDVDDLLGFQGDLTSVPTA